MPTRDDHHADDGKQAEHHAQRPQHGWIGVARAAEPMEQRRSKKRKRSAIQGNGRRPENQTEAKDAAHARTQRPAWSRESEDDMEHRHGRCGKHEQRRDAHHTRTQPPQCPLQSPVIQVDRDRRGNADGLQQEQNPVGDCAALDDAAQRDQHGGQRDSVNGQRGSRPQSAPRQDCGGNREKDEQRLVEQGWWVGCQPPQRHQGDEQRCGKRSPVGVLRRSGAPRTPVEEPARQRQDADEQRGQIRSIAHEVARERPPRRADFRGDHFETSGCRADLPQGRLLQLQSLRTNARLLRPDKGTGVVDARQQRNGAGERGQNGILVLANASVRGSELSLHRSRTVEHRRGNRVTLQKRRALSPFLSVGIKRAAVMLKLPGDDPEFVDVGRHVTPQHP